MARRLRPPSEPPRPQNGHSPSTSDAPPWAASANKAAEVPWDRPADEPWPPTQDADAGTVQAAEPTAEIWTATPDANTDTDTNAETEMRADAPAESQPTNDDAYAFDQAMWSSQPATWPPADEQDDEPNESVEAHAEAQSEPQAQPEPEAEPEPEPEQHAVATQVAPAEAIADTELDSSPETMETTDSFVSGRAPWDKPAPYAGGDAEVDDRPAAMLEAYDSYDEMTPWVTRAVAAASVAAPAQAERAEAEPVEAESVNAESTMTAEPVEAESTEATAVEPAESAVESTEAEAAMTAEPAMRRSPLRPRHGGRIR